MSTEVPGEQGGVPRESAGSPEPGEVLRELAAVRRRTRSARHAYWFPLVLFGVLTCAAAPLYVSAATPPAGANAVMGGAAVVGGAPTVLGGMPAGGSGFYLGWYWLVALVGGYLLTLFWYRWHARRIGVETPARGYIATGVVLTVLVVLLPLLSHFVPFLGWLWPGDLWIRGTFAFLIIAAGLWILARAERSVALAITAAVYTGAAVLVSLYNVENLLFRMGWNPSPGNWSLTVLPGILLPAVVLLVAGLAAFVAQRRIRSA
ncbi:MAG TPA: hypothetical protein VII22_26910 [Streptosporangiaceae bacterium]